ncbi:cyclin-A3-2-like [Lolium rigidum]|uniref:cyclin-A3-2-like n=1 Tax=Lolium rigidum TaxID=89674 RepID=UPI001F5DE2B0|nr:cyclin-A3-2-like [Lolium rigidum]
MGCVAGRARLLPVDSEPAVARAAIAPYIEDIDSYMRYLEKLRRPTDYMSRTGQVQPSWRAILVDWLVEVADEFNFPADTLHLAVSYVDRFLSVGAIVTRELQLLGATSMFLAAKYESDECTHKAKDYCYVTDNSYTEQQVVKMEAHILHLLNFEMGSPTARTFLRRYVTICPRGDVRKLEFLCSYLADLSLLEYDCTKFRPSVVAAACLFVARFTINPDSRPWNLVLQRRVGYKVSDLRSCILKIHRLQSIGSYPGIKETAIKDKYSHCELECVSAMGSPCEIPEYYFKDIKDHKNTASEKWKRSRHI